jgi:hypothetical protein
VSFTPEQREKVLQALKTKPEASQREIAKMAGVHRDKVSAIFKDPGFIKARKGQPTKVSAKKAPVTPPASKVGKDTPPKEIEAPAVSQAASPPFQGKSIPEIVAEEGGVAVLTSGQVRSMEPGAGSRRPPPPSAPPRKLHAREVVGAAISRLREMKEEQPHRNRVVRVDQALALLESPEVQSESQQPPMQGDLYEVADALFGVARTLEATAGLTVARAATVCAIIEGEPEPVQRPLVDMGSLGNKP